MKKISKFKDIYLFIRKHFLFLIPLFLLILYFLYPILVVTFYSLSQTINQKEGIDKIITEYENSKAEWYIFGEQGERLSLIHVRAPLSSEPDFSNPFYNTYYLDIYEIKQSSFIGLFLKNFSASLAFVYERLIKIFHLQNIGIILLGLILYYGVIFGITITKRLEKQK